VGRPHGLDGSFHVTLPRPALLRAGATVRIGERDLEIVRRAGTDERPIVRLAGVDGRDAAEALRGTDLLVPRAAAPPLEDDEWWATDLVGCRVVDGERDVGSVARLVALPSCEALEVSGAGLEFLVPLVRDAVRSVDIAAKRIDVDLAFLGDTGPSAAGGAAAAADEDAPAAAGDEAPATARDEAAVTRDEAPAVARDEAPATARDEDAPTRDEAS
jgi:16S rRNA processing protein RimM